ncbi:MAG: aminomethyl-transferring glycine dehydrogenase subunit GcvPB [Caldisericia bacterium]|nr:aminomethyl-transferring glycine dehydrogenase subunit GcvPB [Caldisericia bacterium]
MKKNIELLYALSHEEKTGYKLPYTEITQDYVNESLPNDWVRKELFLPNVSEVEVARHFFNLSKLNYGVEDGMYPLGSCTMKYNPKMNEHVAQYDGFQKTHPLQADNTVSGNLFLLFDLEDMLCEITGMDAFTLSPAAGAHGEFTGILLIRKYFEDKGEADTRTIILIPESAHGTNPASAVAAGFDVEEIKSTATGEVDLDSLREKLSDKVAGIMLTNPNTTGMFESNIKEIAALLHENGSLLYYDGANLNAILGIARPGDMGFDIVHLNIHKTFSTPHGGGGPGAGPVGVKEHLISYLPEPIIGIEDDSIELPDMDIEEKLYRMNRMDKSIGRIRLTDSSFSVLVKAYAYILTLGEEHIHEVGENAVLNANYIKAMLKDFLYSPIALPCMHECVLSASKLENGITALDISKRLMDYGFHPPTNYFPLIIPEALMIEPTETETKEEMDRFITAMKTIVRESKENPALLKSAPTNTPIRRTNDTKAAKDLDIAYKRR